MLCFRMLSRFSNPACFIGSISHPTLHPPIPSPFSVVNASIVFNELRTLFTSLPAKITRILFPINHLRTLAKTTGGVIHHFSSSLFRFSFYRLSPLESALTQRTPVTPLESALTIYVGGYPRYRDRITFRHS